MKLTDEQIVKAATEAAKVYGPDENTHRHAFQLGYETAIKQMQDKWISVKDELPKIYQEVLVYERDLGFYLAKLGQFYFETEIGNLEDVTHWMPLPEPPSQ